MKAKKGIVKKKLIIEGLIAIVISIVPIFFYIYKYIPDGVQEVNFIGINFGANGFEDVSTAFYYYFKKLIPLVLLIIWFVTSKQWWYHAILIPIAMYSFQFYSIINLESTKVDENEILYIVGISMVIIPVVYFIRIKLVDKYIHGIDLKAMDTELQILKAKEELRKEREKLEQRKETLSKKM
jgi:hypothetical protein